MGQYNQRHDFVSKWHWFLLAATICLCFVQPRAGATDCTHTENSLKCVQFLRNYDGDTVTVTVPDSLPIFGKELSVRVKGVDTPELRAKVDCEKTMARAARDFVKQELQSAQVIHLHEVERGKYFRIVADVIYDGKNLTNELLRRGFARPYDGGQKSRTPWC